MKYVIEFTYEPGVVQYAGLLPDNSLGFAPTLRTAMVLDKEAAERFLQNGYGNLRDVGKVISLQEAQGN